MSALFSASPAVCHVYVVITGGNSGEAIWENRALCDKFSKFCMVIGMDTRFSKIIASKLSSASIGLYVQNPIWPPPIKVNSILRLLFALEPCAIPLFLCLGGKDSIYEVICVFQGHFQSERSFSRAFGTFPFLILSVHPIHFSFRRHVKTHYFQAAFNTPAPLIHLWLTALYKFNYLFTFLEVASKIVPNSVDTNYNISTIRNYGYKFDTNACIIRPRCSRSVATYSHQTFPWTICRSVCPSVGLSSALWKNGRSNLHAVWHYRSDGSRDEAHSGVWGSVHWKWYFKGRIWNAPL